MRNYKLYIEGPRFSPKQWSVLSSAISNLGQAIILFSLAAYFVPEAVQLKSEFPKVNALLMLFFGTIVLAGSVIITPKGEKR